jgi:streptogrisin C
MQRRRIAVAAAIATAALTAVAFTVPSMAGTSPSGSGSARTSAKMSADGLSPRVLAAMRRDLGVDSADAARARLTKQAWASAVTADLRAETGASYAGAWLSKDGTTLNVAVTDATMADEVTATGATAKVFERSEQELASAKEALDAVATTSDRKLPGWYVDVASNKVVVLAHDGDADQARSLISDAGLAADSVKIVTSRAQPKPLFDVRGADPYFITLPQGTARCSIGFSVVGGFVTAGHCGTPGTPAAGFNRVAMGTVRASVFPGEADMGFVETNADWTPRAVVNDFAGNELPVAGNTEAPVGAAICRSGSTTGTFCGQIQAKNQTVNYPEGTVTGLTRTDVCAEGGDSGGPWLSGDQAQGVTSGGSGDCTNGGETFFQPINEILTANNLTLLTTENVGAQPPAEQAPPAQQAPPAGEAPPAAAPPAGSGDTAVSCDQLAASRTGALRRTGSAQAQPRGGAFRANAGTQTACLNASKNVDFDLFLQRQTRRGFVTVAKATGSGDKVLTFDGRAGTYRYVVLSDSGRGSYTLDFDTP